MNVIKLGYQRTEFSIKWEFDEYQINRWHFISGRFVCFAIAKSIKLYDLFLGVEKNIVSKTPVDIIQIWTYVSLSINKAFIVYDGESSHSAHMSLISIDFDNETYEIIDSKLLESNEAYNQTTFHDTPNFIFSSFHETEPEQSQFKLNICKLNSSFSKIEHHRRIDILSGYRCFHILDKTIVFVRINRSRFMTAVETLMYIDENDRFVEMENTGASLRTHPEGESIDDCCWHESTFFYFYTLYDVYVKRTQSHVSIPFLWTFEVRTKQWSEINLTLPLESIKYRFDVDSDGFLSLVKYKNRKSISVTRIALKSPDKLLNLCWFKMHNSGISDK